MSGFQALQPRANVVLVPAALCAAAAVTGGAFAVAAWAFHPLLVPGALVVVAVVIATLREPAVGVAAGFLLVPLSNLGLTGQPPWLFTALWGLFLALLGVWRRRPEAAGEPVRLPGAVPVVGYAVVAVVAFVLGGAAAAGVPELRALVTGFLYFVGLALLIRTRSQVMWCLAGVTASVALVGALAAQERAAGVVVAQAFFTPDGVLVGRAAAGFGHPNSLGGFLVVLMPFAVAGLLIARRGRLLFAGAIALGMYGIYASFSRGALIGLIIVPFFFMRGRRLALIAPAVALLLAVSAPGLVKERFATLTSSGSEVATRVDFWTSAIAIWEAHPVLGAGLGRFADAYAEVRVPGRGFLPGTISQPPPHAHNLVLQVAATAGLLGVVALAAVLGWAVAVALALRRNAERATSKLGAAGLAALAAFTLHNQFDVTLLEGTGIYFWALLGLLAGAWMHEREATAAEGRHEPAPSAWTNRVAEAGA